MNETFQPGLHPDADQLAAFVEQALPLHEREQTMAHLAVCGDCRQIVFLAQAAAPEEAPQPAPAVRRPWFSGWNLLWPAVAALAGIVGFSIYLGRVHETNRTTQNVTTAVVSEPPPPVAVNPRPVPDAENLTAEKMQTQEPQGAIHAGLAAPPKPAQAAADTPLQAEDRAISAAPPKLPQAASAKASAVGGIVLNGAPTALDGAANLPVAGRSAVVLGSPVLGAAAGTGQAAAPETTQPPAPKQFRNYAAVPKPATASAPALAAAPPPPPPAAPAPQFAENQSSQNSQLRQSGQASTTVTVEANAAPVQLDTTTSATLSSLVPVLPSHLETISSTSNGSNLLAVDSGGSVFLSHDDGKHWTGVSAAWAGRPVKVELAAPATTDRSVSGLFKKTAPAPTSQDADSNASATVITGETLASAGGAQLHGVVTDPTGASIPGAQVRVQAAGAASATTVRTDAAGRFQASGMPSGRYEVTITAPGFSTLVRAVELDARTPTGFTVVLPVGAASESVTVESADSRAAAPKLAKKQKSSGFQLTTDTGVVWVSSDGRNWKRR